MNLSVFDIFKIGIGPSSSHTMGPMRAARAFVLDLERDRLLGETAEIAVRLYGSLALTGAGHGTDRAVLLGLEGNDPETIDPERIETELARIRTSGRLRLAGRREIAFDEPMQLLFMKHERLPAHSNGMRFTALAKGGRKLREEDYYSVGETTLATRRRSGAMCKLLNARSRPAGGKHQPPFAARQSAPYI